MLKILDFYLDKKKSFITKKILIVPCTINSSFFSQKMATWRPNFPHQRLWLRSKDVRSWSNCIFQTGVIAKLRFQIIAWSCFLIKGSFFLLPTNFLIPKSNIYNENVIIFWQGNASIMWLNNWQLKKITSTLQT